LHTATATSIRIGRVTVEDSVPVAVLDQNDMVEPLTPLMSADENDGISPWQTRLHYGRNYTVQNDSELADDVDPADRLRFTAEWRVATSEDAAVLTLHPFSLPTEPIQTLYADLADAETAADRRQALRGPDHEWYTCGIRVTTTNRSITVATLLALDLLDAPEVVNSRWLPLGRRMRIMGVRQVASEDQTTIIRFQLWGKP
jgi:hypothetical protein